MPSPSKNSFHISAIIKFGALLICTHISLPFQQVEIFHVHAPAIAVDREDNRYADGNLGGTGQQCDPARAVGERQPDRMTIDRQRSRSH